MTNPSGLCQCGCGQRTSLARYTDSKRGYVKGVPVDFVKGHVTRRHHPGFVERDMGYTSPCWIWTGYIDVKGYARLHQQPAYKCFYEAVYGPVGSALLHHQCEQTACVNPDHLAPVSRGDHIRLHASLSHEVAAEIREAAGSRREIAERFGISKAHVTRIKNGRSWALHDPQSS